MKKTVKLWLILSLVVAFYQCKQPSVPILANTTPTRFDNMVVGNPMNGAWISQFGPTFQSIKSLF